MKKNKFEKQRPDQVPHWVNEELPDTLDALKLYLNYLEGEIQHCQRMTRRMDLLFVECNSRIAAREKELKDARTP